MLFSTTSEFLPLALVDTEREKENRSTQYNKGRFPVPVLHLQIRRMTSVLKLSYEKLRNEGLFEEEDGYYDDLREKVIGRQRSITRFRKVHVRKRLKFRIPGLGRLLRRKARLVKVGWRKVVSRLKESQSHFGDLFVGNYLFMQISPTPLKAHVVRKSLQSYPVADLPSSTSSSARFSLSKVV